MEKVFLESTQHKNENLSIQQQMARLQHEIKAERESNQKIIDETYEENKSLAHRNTELNNQIQQILEVNKYIFFIFFF